MNLLEAIVHLPSSCETACAEIESPGNCNGLRQSSYGRVSSASSEGDIKSLLLQQPLCHLCTSGRHPKKSKRLLAEECMRHQSLALQGKTEQVLLKKINRY